MKLSRRITNCANFVLDQLLPPFIRDSRWFAYLFMYPVARDKTSLVLDFRERVHHMSPEELAACYRETTGLISRETDLGASSFQYLLAQIENKVVVEVGAGRGHLARALSRKNHVTACDFLVDDGVPDTEQLSWRQADAQHLPFPDRSFDVVVSTHTLEHVRDFDAALAELRRVGRERLFVVVPLQRPYRYTPDLHIWYFPYPFSFLARARPQPGTYSYQILDGDLVYEESLGNHVAAPTASSSPTPASIPDQGIPGSR
jgi:ubiquinone/menaquinone biosynthesis C-methylase UbiE